MAQTRLLFIVDGSRRPPEPVDRHRRFKRRLLGPRYVASTSGNLQRKDPERDDSGRRRRERASLLEGFELLLAISHSQPADQLGSSAPCALAPA